MRKAKITESLDQLEKAGLDIRSVIDVGVQHSTPFLIEKFPHVPHFLFEPVSEYFPRIRHHYAGIEYHLIEAAVSDHDGRVILHSEKKTRGEEISHSYIVKKFTASSRHIPAMKLDTYFSTADAPFPALLKIDVEGPGVPSDIIRGSTQVLKKTGAVIIEMTVDRFMERAVLLHEAGFDIWDICDLCYYGDCLWQCDVVFVRRDLKDSHPALRPMHDRPFRPELWQGSL